MNRDNLKRLAVGFYDIQQQEQKPAFDMYWLAGTKNSTLSPLEVEAKKHECGTSMCYLGHGPLVDGLRGPSPQIAYVKGGRYDLAWCDWLDYEKHYFSLSQDEFMSLFDAKWPNDVDHAIKRTYLVLEGFAEWLERCPSSEVAIEFDFDSLDAAAIVNQWRAEL